MQNFQVFLVVSVVAVVVEEVTVVDDQFVAVTIQEKKTSNR
jgi:hypothetical protein